MIASNLELILEIVPLLLLGISIYKLLMHASFHSRKYLSRPGMNGQQPISEDRDNPGM